MGNRKIEAKIFIKNFQNSRLPKFWKYEASPQQAMGNRKIKLLVQAWLRIVFRFLKIPKV